MSRSSGFRWLRPFSVTVIEVSCGGAPETTICEGFGVPVPQRSWMRMVAADGTVVSAVVEVVMSSAQPAWMAPTSAPRSSTT